jgi:hypothetical protein
MQHHARRSTITSKDLPCCWPQLTNAVPLSLHCPLLTAAVSPAPSPFSFITALSVTTPSSTSTQRHRKYLPFRLISVIHLINGTNTIITTTTSQL